MLNNKGNLHDYVINKLNYVNRQKNNKQHVIQLIQVYLFFFKLRVKCNFSFFIKIEMIFWSKFKFQQSSKKDPISPLNSQSHRVRKKKQRFDVRFD